MRCLFVSDKRFRFFSIGVMVCFLMVVGRLVYLHVLKQKDLMGVVEQSRQRFEVLNARRGDIVDSKGNLLATTESVVELGVDPQMVRQEDKGKWGELAKLLGMNLKELEPLMLEKGRRVKKEDGTSEIKAVRWRKLAESVDDVVYDKIMGLGIKGVYGNRMYKRVYPGNQLAGHVMGYVDKEMKAAFGVERMMDFYLTGQNGWRESEKDGVRKELAQFRYREVPAVDGMRVQLTIDSVVQHTIEKELEFIAKEYEPISAVIIVSEPATGYILGMANYPSFNPNEYGKSDISTHRNRAITDVFEPGSPFKIVTASGAYEQHVVDIDDIYDCGVPVMEYRGRALKLPKDHKPYGKLSFREVIKKSSNRGVAQMAMRLGEEKLHRYASLFGYGEETGIGLDGEVKGMLHPVKRWDGLTITRLPMGHALNCTALQLHYATTVVANGGVLMQPQLVRRVMDKEGNVVVDYAPKAKRRVITQETAEMMSELLVGVVGPEGTSQKGAIEGVEVAGKSGTTQKIINGRYSHSHHVATFSGFFPARSPQVAITVVLDQPKAKVCAYGGQFAAPVNRRIGEQLMQYLCIKPTVNREGELAYKNPKK